MDAPAARPVLVLYAPADEAFVRGFLLPALGPSAHGEPVVDARDLATAEVAALDAALADGGTAIPVLTPAFLTNPWARQTEALASGAAVHGDLEVVPIQLEDCDLPPHIRYRVVLDFRDRARWQAEIDRLRKLLSRPRPVPQPLPCPYPGMRPFTADDARYFYGRDDEIDAVIGLVSAGEREIYLIGPSGSGKSSLIAAGVLPRLAALARSQAEAAGEAGASTATGTGGLVVRTVKPGDAPRARLAECIEAGGAALDAAAVTAWAARHPGARLVVFVDQLEELFTQAAPAERDGFAAGLAALRAEPRCVLLLAVRADFYAELLQSQLWLDGRRRHVDLPPLRGAALREAIERPARALEVYFEPGLIDRLLADAAGEPGVLPLLQETLVQLWGRRFERLVTRAAYAALGDGGHSGLAVAISSRADRCLAELTAAQLPIARRVLLRLVSFGDGRPNTRRRQTRAQLAAGEQPAAFDGVLHQLIAARLVTADGDDRAGDARIDLCHEILITAWPSFARWVDSRRADEQRRRQIQASAEEWIARGRGASGLLDDGELASALAWRRTDAAGELGESRDVSDLIDASRRAVTRARTRRRLAVAAVVAGLAVFAGVTTALAIRASRQADIARAHQLDAERSQRATVRMLGEQYLETGRQAVVDGRLQRALVYLVAARDQGIDNVALRTLFHIASTVSVTVALRHDRPVAAIGLSGDGARVVTASGTTVRIWSAETGREIAAPLVHAGRVTDAVIRGDGTRVATTTDDNTAWIWEVGAHPPPPIALHHTAAIHVLAFSGDGERVMTAGDDGAARLWSARTGEPIGRPFQHDAGVMTATLSPDGTRLATTVNHGTSSGLWNVATGARIASFELDLDTATDFTGGAGHLSLAMRAVFSGDGRRLVTVGSDRHVLLWDPATGAIVKAKAGKTIDHQQELKDVALSPDGSTLVVLERFGVMRWWNPATYEPLGPPIEARAERLIYSADGSRLIAMCWDKMLRIWDTASRIQIAEIEIEAGTIDTAANRDATRIATASFDGIARLWSVRPLQPRTLHDTRSLGRYVRAFDAAFSRDGARIAASDDTGGVSLWSAAGALQVKLKSLVGAARVGFDSTGARFSLSDDDGAVEIGDTTTGALHPFARVMGRNPTGSTDGVKEVSGHAPQPGGFSPDGRRFATLTGPRMARIWNIETGEPSPWLLEHDAAVRQVQWSPDGRRVITAGADATARIWDAATGAAIGVLHHASGVEVSSALWSPDGRHIATVGSNAVVRLWDAAGQLERELTGHTNHVIAARFSPDSARLLTNSDDNTARLWDVATGALAVPPLVHDDQVGDASFSPDGGVIATTCDEFARLWDARTGRPISAPLAHVELARSAAFSPDGTTLLTVGFYTIQLWDIAPDTRSLDDWHRLARDGAPQDLSKALDRGPLPAL